MTKPTKWPEPVGHILKTGHGTHLLPGAENPAPDFVWAGGPAWQSLYTANQVREIVAAETAQLKLDADEMVRQMLLEMQFASKHEVFIGNYLDAMRDARKWLKENKDAD